MKKGFLTLAFIALPSLCGSGEYTRKISLDEVIENRGGRFFVKKRSDLSKKLETFVRNNGADAGMAKEIAELLGTFENGKVLAAIAATESRFNIRAEGLVGEIGAYQVRPEVWGHPGDSFRSQTDKTNSILEELLRSTKGNLEGALKKYNGKGRRSEMYASRVLSLVSSI